MNCHERTIAALNLQQPDRAPVFSCTEEQNQIYEILGEEGGTVPLSLVQQGISSGAHLRRAAGDLMRQTTVSSSVEVLVNA